MELLRFKQPIIITGPLQNVMSVYNMVSEGGARLDTQLSKALVKNSVLVCVNRSIVKPQYKDFIKHNETLHEEMLEHTPMIYWQSHMWWDYYHNKKINAHTKSIFLTLNACSQFDEIKNTYLIWK